MSFAVHFKHSSFSPSADVKPMQSPFSANLFYLCMYLDLLGHMQLLDYGPLVQLFTAITVLATYHTESML